MKAWVVWHGWGYSSCALFGLFSGVSEVCSECIDIVRTLICRFSVYSSYCVMVDHLPLVLTCVLFCFLVIRGDIKRWNTNMTPWEAMKCYNWQWRVVLSANLMHTNKEDGHLLLTYARNLFRVSNWYCVVASVNDLFLHIFRIV